MDINDFFKGFFGFPRMRPEGFNDPFFRGGIDVTGHDEDDMFPNHPKTDLYDDMFPNLFHHMEDMLHNVFTFQPGFLDFPDLDMQEKSCSARDMMLKPECASCHEDQRLPVQFAGKDQIDSDQRGFFPEKRLEVLDISRPKPANFSFQKSFSSKIVRSGNGVVEEHRTVKDSSGKTITTVRKSLGDKTYEVTTQTDENGLVEKTENFINMDQSEIPQFEDALKGSLVKPEGRVTEAIEPMPSVMVPKAPPGDPKYLSIFRKFFGL